MTKSERNRLLVLGAILSVTGSYAYFATRGGSGSSTAGASIGSYSPIAVENPSLRMDLLDAARKAQYVGTERNIFSEIAPPPPPTKEDIAKADAERQRQVDIQAKLPPPPPPPVQVGLKFYGYTDDPATGNRRAFFTNGDDIFIAGIGDTLQNRLRVIHIGNDSVELEEISSERRAFVTIEPDATGAQGGGPGQGFATPGPGPGISGPGAL
jgi:hypothetical protein